MPAHEHDRCGTELGRVADHRDVSRDGWCHPDEALCARRHRLETRDGGIASHRDPTGVRRHRDEENKRSRQGDDESYVAIGNLAIANLAQLFRAPASIQALMRARFVADSFGPPGGMEPPLTVE